MARWFCNVIAASRLLALALLLATDSCHAVPVGSDGKRGLSDVSPLSSKTKMQHRRQVPPSFATIPRGGDLSPVQMFTDSADALTKSLKGPKTDTLVLLLTTALNTPICQKLKVSPILGFLGLGILFGPNGKGIINDLHLTEVLAELGIVMFLFEMGIHLDFKTLMDMKTDVFGIGFMQFSVTTIVISLFCATVLGLSTSAAIIIGWSLALSSSAFVLQLLKDKGQLETTYGKSSFGTLLLQDLMVVPLLVITPILAGSGGTVGEAVGKALVQIAMALTVIFAFGKFLLNPFLENVVGSKSEESFIGMILGSVFGMSFLTEGLGLSNTLGPFLMGMLTAETKYRHEVEVQASPFRGILVGIFFLTVGFEIDLNFIVSKAGLIALIVLSLMAVKAILAASACMAFGVDLSVAQRVGFVLSQGGEFAFVAFRAARSSGILDEDLTKLLLTCVSLSMALTPLFEDIGAKIQAKLEEDGAGGGGTSSKSTASTSSKKNTKVTSSKKKK